ncbi:hypothetical protein [Propionispora sp. 2/2-37]|nr:hypothetical protein [Propionispora sp. 2/2-37]
MKEKPEVWVLQRAGGRCKPVCRPDGSAPEWLVTNYDGFRPIQRSK